MRADAVRVRVLVATCALMLTSLAISIGTVVETRWADGPGLVLGPLKLQVTYNPGVAFGVGDTLPGGVVTAGTGSLTAAIIVYVLRTAPRTALIGRVGLTLLIAGASANTVDRGIDGVVIDYCHTGWWPTFNLPDIFITGGVGLAVASSFRSQQRRQHHGPDSVAETTSGTTR